jgi:hypothetical protein
MTVAVVLLTVALVIAVALLVSAAATMLARLDGATLCRSKIRFGAVSCGEAVRSGASLVQVDQASQEALTPDPVGLEVGDGGRSGRFGAVRGQLLPGLVRTVPVVVPEVFGQD